MQLDHIAIGTKDFEKLTRWYADNLGFAVTKEWTLEELLPGKRIAYLEREGVKLEIVGNGAMAKEAVYGDNVVEEYMIPGYRHFAIRVADLDGLFADLAGKGVPVAFPPTDFPVVGIRAGIVQDCDGNTLEFIEPLR